MRCVKDHIFNCHLRYLAAFFLLTLLFVPISLYFNILNTTNTLTFAGHSLTILAILFAGFQFRANHDWNRRQLAITSLKEIRKTLTDSIKTIDSAFSYVNRQKHQSIQVDAIHDKICVKDDKGKLVYIDGKLKVDHQGEGVHIEQALSTLLDSYEYIGSGVEQGVFDKEIVYSLYGGPIIRAFRIFEKYIDHVNMDMFPDRHNKIYENFRKIAICFENREKEKYDQNKKGRQPAG